MPKMKTHRGAAKRFKVTGTGKIMPPQGVHEPHPREEVLQADPAPQARDRASPAATPRSVKQLLGLLSPSTLPHPAKGVTAWPGSSAPSTPRSTVAAILEQAQGYYGNKSRSFRAANEQVMHSLQYAFRDRRARKGDFRPAVDPAHQRRRPQHGMSATAGSSTA